MNWSHCEHKHKLLRKIIDCNTSVLFHWDTNLMNTSAKQAQPRSQGSLLPFPTETEPGNKVEASKGPAHQIVLTNTQHYNTYNLQT